jgi:hypothetical protein
MTGFSRAIGSIGDIEWTALRDRLERSPVYWAVTAVIALLLLAIALVTSA